MEDTEALLSSYQLQERTIDGRPVDQTGRGRANGDMRRDVPAHWIIRSGVNAALQLATWAAGYTAAQMYFTAIQGDLGISNFVTVGSHDSLQNTVPQRVIAKGFGIAIGVAVAFAVATHLMVKLQLAVAPHVGHGIAVFFVKWADNIGDGATFFSANLMYSCLISAVKFSSGRALLPELAIFSAVLVIVAIIFVIVYETTPHMWAYPARPTLEQVRINQHVSDWFRSKWTWLMGFAWFTTAISVLGPAYLGVHDKPEAWWALCGAIAAGHVLHTTACGRRRPPTRTAMVVAPADAVGNGSCCGQHKTQHRVVNMLDRAVGWTLGISLYFALRVSFPQFSDALAMRWVSQWWVLTFVGAVTGGCWVLLFGLEVLVRFVEAHHHSMVTHHLSALERVVGGLEATLKLTLCYLTGKAWEALTFGLGARASSLGGFALIGLYWQLGAGLLAVLHTRWVLTTEHKHGASHSPRCVCPVCAPELHSAAE